MLLELAPLEDMKDKAFDIWLKDDIWPEVVAVPSKLLLDHTAFEDVGGS